MTALLSPSELAARLPNSDVQTDSSDSSNSSTSSESFPTTAVLIVAAVVVLWGVS